MANFFRQLGAGVASLTFGVALSIFIYAAATTIPASTAAWLLYASSFLLMLRFWWRYTELFVQFLPSRSYWHFLLDFAVAFFGILAVLLVNALQAWAALGIAAMAAAAGRCGLAWRGTAGDLKQKLRRTLWGAVGMAGILAAVWAAAPAVDSTVLAAAVLGVVLIFIIWAAAKP